MPVMRTLVLDCLTSVGCAGVYLMPWPTRTVKTLHFTRSNSSLKTDVFCLQHSHDAVDISEKVLDDIDCR